jgi:WD repeat-containing protein 31
LKVVHSFPKKQYIQSSCHMSDDSYYAISTSNGFQGEGCEITVWDLRNRRMLSELTGHEQTVTNARIFNSDKYIISSSNDSTVRLWDLKKLGF